MLRLRPLSSLLIFSHLLTFVLFLYEIRYTSLILVCATIENETNGYTLFLSQVLGASPLDRSLIFPITITGCLAGTLAEADFCVGRLSSVGADAESFGNCLAARQLIRRVWEKRVMSGYAYREDYDRLPPDAAGPGSSDPMLDASWRTVMHEMSENPLLLV